MSIEPAASPASLTTERPGLPLCVHTGYLDDRRQVLKPKHRSYAIFLRAYRNQDAWDDPEYRDFWTDHLALWGGRRGARSNREALAMVLVLGRAQGNTYGDVIAAMPAPVTSKAAVGRSRDDLRDREVLAIADRMWVATRDPLPEPDEDPRPWPMPSQHEDGSWSIPGPAHPDVIRAERLWRTPRVYVANDWQEEGLLPPPLRERSTLPPTFGDAHACAAIGTNSLEVFRQGLAVLERLRALS